MDEATRRQLEAAYRVSTYRAGDVLLRVGEPSARLDELLRASGADEWAFLTAWNPASMRLDEEMNEARQTLLRERLAGHPVVEGYAEAPDGSWREPSLLVMGIPRARALRIALAFGQNAILAGRRGGVVDLAWTD